VGAELAPAFACNNWQNAAIPKGTLRRAYR
jgi:hypothetical protein